MDVLLDSSISAPNALPLPNNKVESLRASYYMMGAMLGRFKKCVIGLPGGCPLGPRPIDQHIKGFKALGAEIDNPITHFLKRPSIAPII
jgi:UDP-N-acetylglucosamine 1-carboxyvinyltransferase